MNIALITGGSRGIGRACALKLAKMGYYVLINYRSNQPEALATLEQIKAEGGNGELLPFNVSDKNSIKSTS